VLVKVDLEGLEGKKSKNEKDCEDEVDFVEVRSDLDEINKEKGVGDDKKNKLSQGS